ncbi:hypothetical protein [Paenibacillus contaminans]|uniref:Uncharacterized protein n=1 Tax=Paenibacillus contaminans TaxID=450362 RepID=A0A329MSK7_9BACL|nr:hypothetical protein [Paenibacillus contaminans]RAV22925.1 hypothetical protein DQG23_01595 [Paenibacillus contaminans]
MSMPNIPDIKPGIHIKRHDVLNLLLSSIALEEMGLSHIINAEGEKLQKVLHSKDHCLSDLLDINDSVERMMRNVIKNQMLLQFKLEDVIKLERMSRRDCDHEEFCEE